MTRVRAQGVSGRAAEIRGTQVGMREVAGGDAGSPWNFEKCLTVPTLCRACLVLFF